VLDAAELIRSHRLAAGLSQRALAKRAGTSSATLHRYEAGRVDPTTATLNRILHACGPLRRRRWPSVAELSAAVDKELRAGQSQDGWRLVWEFLDDDSGADDREVIFTVSEPPRPAGDRRADALAAALAEYVCVRRQLVPPAWTQVPIEVVPWWFVSDKRFHALALRESPISFARRGIFVTAGALQRI
jgi:transcriptional regulator with XRE-family HTH domain